VDVYRSPGVFRQERFSPPASGLRSAVPLLLGLAEQGPLDRPLALSRPAQFAAAFGAASGGYLGDAVRGFFANQGRLCYVLRLADNSELSLAQGLAAGETIADIDLVCAPDCTTGANPVAIRAQQRALLEHCQRQGDRFAILDALPGAGIAAVIAQRQGLDGADGALYFPWISETAGGQAQRFLPPCGHIAGIYARTDAAGGVYRAPANALLEGVLDLRINLSSRQQEELNPLGINGLCSFAGRGIRVWGARTLSSEAEWRYIGVRRLFLYIRRRIENIMAGMVFENSEPRLWSRIERELAAYCRALFQQGALAGSREADAFYVKCDAETNPPALRECGEVVAEVGLAPAAPAEFVVLRLVQRSER
jgi:uncharacterized protein